MPVHHGADLLYKIATKSNNAALGGAATGPLLKKMAHEADAQGETIANSSTVTYTYSDGTTDSFVIGQTSGGRFVVADTTSPALSWP